MVHEILITKSNKTDKEFKAEIDGTKTLHFGAKGMSDFTKHTNVERKQRYVNRHKPNEDWTSSGLKAAGFYAKHILWNKPTLQSSVKDLNNKFSNIKVKLLD